MTLPAASAIDLESFVWLWNRRQAQETPKLHLFICRWLTRMEATSRLRLLLMAFRNSGKSTLVGLYCAWTLLVRPETRILVLAADDALARKMVRNVKRIIERHPLTSHLKPDRADQWASGQFTVRRATELRDPSMLAKGVGANITGSRADVIICDDVEVPNTCDTSGKREDLRARLAELDFILVPGGQQLYVGTPHSYYTIYAEAARKELGEDLPFLAGFERLKLALLDEAGASRWPERFPDRDIEALKARAGPARFASQMMLEPRTLVEGRLDPELLQPYEAELEASEGNGETLLKLGQKRLVSATCWWDPAFGKSDASDASVVAAVFTDEDGDHWLHRMLYLAGNGAQGAASGAASGAARMEDPATWQCRTVARFADSFHLPSVTLETNGLGRFLPGLLRKVIGEAGLSIGVVELANHRPKDHRILEAIDAPLAARRLHAHRSVFATRLITEMREWRPGIDSADDGLDALAGALTAEPVRLTPTWRLGPSRSGLRMKAPPNRTNWTQGSQQVAALHCFDPFAPPDEEPA
ncbi:MAG: phage terminase large subunit [Magnetovibrionaceae bacterium]